MSAELRIIELETRQAFQDDTIQALNDVVVEQGRVIERLQLQMAELIKRYEEMVGQIGSEGKRPHHLTIDEWPPWACPRAVRAQRRFTATTSSACRPLSRCITENSTRWPSTRMR